MAIRYSAEQLLHLRDSPLCVKPDSLPPAGGWMGASGDQTRTSQNKGVGNERSRNLDNPFPDQMNRRTGLGHVARNSTTQDPEDIVFAPPRMAFASSGRGNKGPEGDKTGKDADAQGRFNNLRNRNGSDVDGDRTREGRTNNLRRRGDSELEEGWSTVKPRKSFGAEGAERFHGRMGGNFRDEKKTVREKEERDTTRDRTARPFDTFNRDREDNDGRPRNGLPRGKLEGSWHRGDATEASAPEKKERDRNKSWRDRDTATEAFDDRRPADRRWGRDRDHRAERDPEWFDEPGDGNQQSHTQQDFQKWMEQMKRAKGGNASEQPTTQEAPETIEAEKQPPASAPAIETGPDKFFLAFGGNSASADTSTTPTTEQKESAPKPKAAGKSSRFTSFFSQSQEEARPRMEQSSSVPPAGQNAPPPLPFMTASGHIAPPEEEKQAFQQLIAKLQKQSMSATPPSGSPFAAPPQAPADTGKKSNYTSPDPFQQYGADRREAPLFRPPPQPVQEILAPRPQQQTARPEQLLQDLAGHQRVSSQGSARPEQSRNNSNTEFLMNLMRSGPDTQQLLRMAQSQQQQQQQQQSQKQHHHMHQQPQMPPMMNERETDFSPRENRGVQQRQMRTQPPPGFPMDEAYHNADRDSRPSQQPTQILQRPPPPPGLDQMPPSWMTSGGQMPPPQPRGPMMPPPGLPGGPNRNMPMPHMFPPNFPPGGMPPPEALAGMPPRNMPMPPPGFFNAPPHGFLPPGLGGFNGPPGPPESHGFGGSPFGDRGLPPGNRGAFSRQ